MANLLVYLYAVLAGAVTNIQVGADLRLFRGIQQPALTAAVILGVGFSVTLLALVVWHLVAGVALPDRGALREVPWWAWAGGALQAVTVLAVFTTAGRAGSALFSALTVTGGAIFSVLLDHYGLVGFQQHSVSWYRVAGGALLIGGTLLMAK